MNKNDLSWLNPCSDSDLFGFVDTFAILMLLL